ncbi:MAG: prolyl oligopeptidase family serine peptidase [Gammaproteobacteria bacterium]|nr:prolyl oligopeptidase family serine peptidase [Gammaproteobacteria bacterium]MBU2675935.1 prolyl oligopeptidase family serine peptidase [Gammaproteobacteria bacterium]NNC56716.1 S9 family peptidase [Woeseiaceae bacterium]NNL49671.1 S9 family peptidase [Woeseiaceae bacterium]
MRKTILIAIGLLGWTYSLAALAADLEPYPLEYWALRPVINNVQVSPDGKYLGLMKIPTKDGNPIIEVYETADLDKEPFRLNADPMEITNFYWVSDKDIVFTLRQKVRDRIEGFNQGVYENRLAVVDVIKKKMRSFDESNAAIEHLLPNKPSKIIISFQEGEANGPASKIKEAYRPRAYWEFDLDRGTKKLLIRGKLALGNIQFDIDGRPYYAQGFDVKEGDYVAYSRWPGEKKWTEAARASEDSFETFNAVGLDPEKPRHWLMRMNNGDDKVGLWSYDTDNRKLDELIYRRKDADVYGVRYHSNRWKYPGKIVGVSYFKDKYRVEYFDEVEGATYKQLEELIPYSHYVNISSRSRDGNTMVVYNAGPRDPGTYYLLKDGRFKTIGSRQPLLESEKLADVKYITYDSRDGRQIPAYLTVPNGEGPFPLIVLPHGGPFVQETVIYDEWSQMLANNGYMVLQPQYRGSLGYGLDFYMSAFMNGGQGGYKMQDDKDDGALHLIEEGLADSDRVAMFGWSYGGYAALVAASRAKQIYQCVIAGAAVSDTNMQVNYYRFQMRGAQRDEQLRMWDDSVAPIDEEEVAKVNVPMLLIHGDVDQRVPIDHARKYRKLLDKYNKNYKYLELEGADHFSNTLFFEHQIELYESMIDFLANDCGMKPDLQASVAE